MHFINNSLVLKVIVPTVIYSFRITEDMGLAENCGFQKLLVLSGVTKRTNIENWTFPENLKPKYYVESLKVIDDILRRLIEKQLLYE